MAAKKDKTLIVKFDSEKETKNTIRYKAQDEEAEIPYNYIGKKGVTDLGKSKSIQVTVEKAS